MKRRQGASAAEKKAREHPPREKKHEKGRWSAIKTEATGFTYSEALLVYIYIYIILLVC
jgi:hypothetical protein